MPGSETTAVKRGGKLLSLLFWAGVALAPLAAVLLLLSQGETMLRAAVVVAVLAVVLIGLSITLRPDSETVRVEIEETLYDEIDALREGVRRDIASAAKATHKSFGERVQALQDTVDGLRAQLDPHGPFERSDLKAPPVARASTGHAPVGGVVRHTETVQVTTRQTIVDADEGRGRVYGGGVYGSPAAEPAPSPRGRADEWTPPSSSREPRDQREPRDIREPREQRDTREPREQRDIREPREESWTEKRLRERAAADRNRDAGSERGGGRRSRAQGTETTRGSARGLGDDPSADDSWSNFRAGDRWASVRADDRGRELRMGERRAAVHADEHGTEFRIEDRWAAVRRDEPSRASRREARWTDDSDSGTSGSWSSRGGEAQGTWSSRGADSGGWSPSGDSGSWSSGGDSGGWSSRGGDSGGWSPRDEDSGDWPPVGRRSARAALPAASAEPSAAEWMARHGEPEPVGRRARRHDDDGWSDDRWERDRDEPARIPRQRRVVDFETSDDRWR
ncbi:MAG TPA: hypothetical protein VF054_19690 [Micromonosporaceae bacterium]